jgi:hypothetical protein
VASPNPVAPPPGAPGPFVALTAGFRHTCGLVAGGAAYCWGTSAFGSMGDGNTAGHTTTGVATAVVGGIQFSMLTISTSDTPLALTCGVSLAGDGYCWGSHSRFALGTAATLPMCTFSTFGPFPCSAEPVLVRGGLKYHEIHASVSRACGRTLVGDIWCWGAIPFQSDRQSPSRVP